jgi:outer membrane lipoprotein SlyB
MEAQAGKPVNPIVVIACIAVILFCAAGIAAIMGWIPASAGGGLAPQAAGTPATAPAQTQPQALAEPQAAGSRQTQAPDSVQPLAQAPVQAPVAEKQAGSIANPAPVPEQLARAETCAGCGVIESVHAVEMKGKSTGLGGVGGAVVGGVLGNQIGAGRGNDVMTVVGAVGGAVAGNEIEKRMNTSRRYQIRVRLDDGSRRVFRQTSLPSWRAGDRVKIVGGKLRPDNA